MPARWAIYFASVFLYLKKILMVNLGATSSQELLMDLYQIFWVGRTI